MDSNVFFYAKIADKKYGESCSNILRELSDGVMRATTSVLTLVEVANAMRKFGLSKDVSSEIHAILSLDVTIHSIDNGDVQESIDIFDKSKISPYDCVHAAVMKRLNIKKIYSADAEFDRIDWITRIDPLEKKIGRV
ncbi:MAG: type II toxin-antitoxin system VapC family toxin [Nitrososphaerales archaeon]